MTEPAEKYKDLDYLISRIGMPAVMLGVICYFFFVKFDKFADSMMDYMKRNNRNERAIMQKMNIPIILETEKGK